MANGTNWSSKKNAYYQQWRQKKKQQNQPPQQQPPQPTPPPQSPLQTLIAAMKKSQSSSTGAGGNGYTPGNGFHAGEGNSSADYTDNNNPALVKWQNQTDETKMARYLAKLSKQGTLPPDNEGYSYHFSNFQNMVHDMNLNAPVYAKLNTADFDAYCKANGLTPIYRGWESGQASKDRFENAEMSHTGSGKYGEGFYFGSSMTGSNYSGGAVTKAALSPNARVVDLEVVKAEIMKLGSNAQKSFKHAGTVPTSAYQDNLGYSQMALKMKYNVIRTSWCYLILSRDAVVTCSDY